MTIVTKLSGGLGNQMFQYALGRHLALLHARPLLIDLHWYHDTPAGSTQRRELVSQLAIVASFANSGGQPASLAVTRRGLGDLRNPVQVRRERTTYRFDAGILDAPPRERLLYLDGYWQSWRYIEPIRDRLADELRPLRAPDPQHQQMARQIGETTSVMLHVRRGDYAQAGSAAKIHGALPLRYYALALQRLRATIASPTVFVFSDDMAWTREHLDVGDDAVFVPSEGGDETVIADWMLMRQCKHQIIANSSLSWWAAWLDPDADRVVIAPERWLQARELDLHDLIPRDWIVLQVD